MLERIVYVSRATPGFGAGGPGAEALYGIVREAHARNPAAGLTGALMHLDGGFAQILEGPAAPLGRAFGRIRHDPRHGGIEIRTRERALCRLFPGQPLALRTRACLDPGLLAAFGYRPGFPAAALPADLLVELLVAACRPRPRPGARADLGARQDEHPGPPPDAR